MRKNGLALFKSLTNRDQINREIEYLRRNNIPHKYIVSNYTLTIETPARVLKFNDNMLSVKAFIAYKMIKKDLAEYTANEPPVIDREKLDYFETYLDKPLFFREGYAVDIKSAYATVLHNDGFISERTFGYIKTLPKKARLAAVGMLASRKDIFYFHGPELTGHVKDVNPLENYFWYCVERTSQLMREIKKETRPLFFWVDCIYFRTLAEAQTAEKILSEMGYSHSRKKIFLFECTTRKTPIGRKINEIKFFQSDDMDLTYQDAGKKNTEQKVFSIPLESEIRKKLVSYLLNQKK